MQAAVVIPAFNEEGSVGKVIEAALGAPDIAEVIVVCDGCTDGTALVARESGAKVIVLETNQGKGAAMMAGVRATRMEVIVFLDADLIGLVPAHLEQLVYPVFSGEADMSIGVFNHGRLATDMAQFLAPYLSGQRAVRRDLLHWVDNAEVVRYGIEVAITGFARRNRWRIREVVLKDLTHIMKEEKLGLLRGFQARIKMYWEIAKCLTNR